jgi:hypothetical protein
MKSDDDKNSYKNHPERCMCMACVIAVATEAAEVIDRLESEKKQIRQQMAELRAERDKARREICIMLEDATNNHRENHAKRWGWDCFKENNK